MFIGVPKNDQPYNHMLFYQWASFYTHTHIQNYKKVFFFHFKGNRDLIKYFYFIHHEKLNILYTIYGYNMSLLDCIHIFFIDIYCLCFILMQYRYLFLVNDDHRCTYIRGKDIRYLHQWLSLTCGENQWLIRMVLWYCY